MALKLFSNFFESKGGRWVFTVFSALSIIVFSVSSLLLYQSSENAYLVFKSEKVAQGIADKIKTAIENRTRVLKIIADSVYLSQEDRFQGVAKSLIQGYSDFYSINLVDERGVIQRVYPESENMAALGKNLLERSDVRAYVQSSRDDNEPRMSHIIMTYQGIPAFVLYVPRRTLDGRFIGWLNAVVDFDTWIKGYARESGLHDTRMVIRWGHPESHPITLGPESTRTVFTYEYKILNQNVSIDIGFAPSDLESVWERHFAGIVIVGLGLLLILVLLIVGLHISRRELERTNQNLSLKNNLLSSLSHDLSTPLMVLATNLEPLIERKSMPDPKGVRGITHALRVMEEMLGAVRMLHAQGLGVLKFEREAVNLRAAVNGAMVLVLDQAGLKGVHIKIEDISSNVFVKAHAATLMNNVILNALTNAIKYSPPGGEVRVSTQVGNAEVSLIFEDQGRGFSSQQIEAFLRKKSVQSTKGTQGEKGTGLGLLQIRGFMEAYGGKVDLRNLDMGGSRLTLIFKRGQPREIADGNDQES